MQYELFGFNKDGSLSPSLKGEIMPVTCRLINERWRVTESDTGRVSTNNNGNPVDGGGHDSAEACQRQARAINANTQN